MVTGRLGRRAIVIGSSITGLMAARVVSDYFEEVLILERDWLSDDCTLHRSVPQGHHPHGLLHGGFEVMSSLYDDFGSFLKQHGAVTVRAGSGIAFYGRNGKSYCSSSMQVNPEDFGFDTYSQSRELLEFCLRKKTLAYANITLQPETMVFGISVNNGRIHGVRSLSGCGGQDINIHADLVINACGRANRVAKWLEECGYPAPEKTVFPVDIGYASARYQIPADYKDDVLTHVIKDYEEHSLRAGLVSTIENNQWMVALLGRFGDYPKANEEDFLSFAKSLVSTKLYDLISDAKRLGNIIRYKYPESVRYHYEQLADYPEGFLVMGDAACSFNPIYGQGMSAAALQVKLLQRLLSTCVKRGVGLKSIARDYYPKAAEYTETPWLLAALSDKKHPQVGIEPSEQLSALAKCLGEVRRRAVDDSSMRKLQAEVFHLLKPVSAFDERLA